MLAYHEEIIFLILLAIKISLSDDPDMTVISTGKIDHSHANKGIICGMV
jgi:hypothetical protein